MKTKKSFLLFIITSLIIIGAGSFYIFNLSDKESVQTTSTNEIPEFNDTLDTAELDYNIAMLEKERDYYKEVISQLFPTLSEQEQLHFVQRQFVYALTVNNKPIPRDGKVQVTAGPIDIVLSEKIPDSSKIYPIELYEQGKVNGFFLDHLHNLNVPEWEQLLADGAGISGQIYRRNLKSGEIINFSITEALRERLQLDTTELQIIVK